MFRRSDTLIKCSTFLLLAVLLLISSSVLADDIPAKGVNVQNKDGQLIITQVDDDGQAEVQIIDLSGIGEMVDEAMAALDDTQFQLRLGQDNMLSLAMDDTAIEVDLDLILSQVGAALSQGFDELHACQWANKGPRDESMLADDQLQVELDRLRAEMRSLRQELKRLQSE